MFIDLLTLLQANQRYLIVFMIFAILDIITGVINAVISHKLKSSVFREGLLKKVLEVIIIVMGFMCDFAFSVTVVGQGCTISLVIMEGWSIIENIQDYVPLPEVLKTFLEGVKNGSK